MDTISSILDSFHLKASVFERARFCGHWAMTHEGGGHACFHLVASGQCWLDRLDGREAMALAAGDLLVMPRDAPHRLGPAPRIGADREPERCALADDEAGPGPGLVCGYFGFAEGTTNPILDALPDYLLIRGSEVAASESLRGVVDLLVREAGRDAVGTAAMINHLSDALFIEVLRHYLQTTEQPTGLLAALGDPVVQRALHLIHARPGEGWSLERLAREVAASRSSLAERFAAHLGVGPMTYLFRWRMQLARRRLANGETVARVAGDCGYASESGFSKAFARYYGHGPGAARRLRVH